MFYITFFTCTPISYVGRQDGTKDISGITHKAPISIDPASGMYFFPTSSPRNKHCSWIAHSHIDFIQPTKNQMTEVHFKKWSKNYIRYILWFNDESNSANCSISLFIK